MELNIKSLPKDADWYGNNAAFTCPVCGKVFIVSAVLNEKGKKKGERECPGCGETVAFCTTDPITKEKRAYLRHKSNSDK